MPSPKTLSKSAFERTIGARPRADQQCDFRVWAPAVSSVELLLGDERRLIPMKKDSEGYTAVTTAASEGTRYQFRIDGNVRPDPASLYQPNGVHGPSQVVSLDFPWTDDRWHGRKLEEYVIYELHIGTFTAEGTFDAAIAHLPELRQLGVTAVEVMPIAQFPGGRGWGYDGVYPFAAQNTYGGPDGFRRFVDACHRTGLAVVLDVVYNHLGPDGNYLSSFGPYFTDKYKTPWGMAVNYDGPDNQHVRRYFIENALHWICDFHCDALRLDAVHAITDFSAQPFLAELAADIQRAGAALDRRVYVIGESDLNDARVVTAREQNGLGLDAQWMDDFHHVLHALLTGERSGYYEDFGRLSDLAKLFSEGYVYSGQYSPHRRRPHGNSSKWIPASRFVVYTQTHDQVGNRFLGERLSQLISFEAQKLAFATVALSPYLPMIFMGEEYGETSPFLYFVSHENEQLADAVRKGRKEEFAAFKWDRDPPDPQSEETFNRSKLHHPLRQQGHHAQLQAWYRKLLEMRRSHPALRHLSKETLDADIVEETGVLTVRRWNDESEIFFFLCFGEGGDDVAIRFPTGVWKKELDSDDPTWGGRGSAVPSEADGDQTNRFGLHKHQAAVFSRVLPADE